LIFSSFKNPNKRLGQNFDSTFEAIFIENQNERQNTNEGSQNFQNKILNTFTDLLCPIANFLEMEDFVKFVFSLSKKQKQYIFRYYLFNLLNSLYILNDKCKYAL
jgi:hypothetical protein